MSLGVATALTKNLLSRRNNQHHNVVGIQGDPGSGKSTLALGIALTTDPSFTVENVHYNRNAWRTIATAPKGQTFILDEGANVAMNRTWMSKTQVQLMQLLNMIRQRHHTLIWCTPNLQRLDVVIREDLITHKINVARRNLARVRTRYVDRDGEPAGWRTWPGILQWPSLDDHAIWPAYYAGKEANFAGKTVEMTTKDTTEGATKPPRTERQREQFEKLRTMRKNRDPETGRIVSVVREAVEA